MEKYLTDILEQTKDNIIVSDAFTKADSIINNPKYKNIICSISGGADSDVMLDLIYKVDKDKKVRYVWFNTGLEYQATKDHLVYLENRYQIKIERERAIKPIPLATKEYGQPFLNKVPVSRFIGALQAKGFLWEDKPYDELIKIYPNSKSALYWWCNLNRGGRFNIKNYKFLKEFLIENPPTFKISAQCCDWAKKKVAYKLIKETKCDLMIIGVRKAEGGIRATSYKNCYDVKEVGTDNYRPLFWFLQEDRQYYEKHFNIIHSKCYTEYGFPRTGCVCCPYSGTSLQDELYKTKIYEPNMYKAVNNVFKESYEYTKQYRQFVREMKDKEKGKRRLF